MIIDVAADGLAVYSRLFSEPAFWPVQQRCRLP